MYWNFNKVLKQKTWWSESETHNKMCLWIAKSKAYFGPKKLIVMVLHSTKLRHFLGKQKCGRRIDLAHRLAVKDGSVLEKRKYLPQNHSCPPSRWSFWLIGRFFQKGKAWLVGDGHPPDGGNGILEWANKHRQLQRRSFNTTASLAIGLMWNIWLQPKTMNVLSQKMRYNV